MADARERARARGAWRDGGGAAAELVARMRAGERSGLPCLDAGGARLCTFGRVARYFAGERTRKRMTGRVCCCGADESDYEHGAGGVESYTHGFVHACEYYGDECECAAVEVEEQVPVYSTSCPVCGGNGRGPLRAGVELAEVLGYMPAAEALGLGPDHCHGCERSGVRFAGQERRTGAARCARCLDAWGWLEAIAARGGWVAQVRTAIAVGRWALALVPGGVRRGARRAAWQRQWRETLEAAEVAAAAGSREELERAARACYQREEVRGWADLPAELVRRRVTREEFVRGVMLAAGTAGRGWVSEQQVQARAARRAWAGARRAIQAELGPWALGERDPVLERVEARAHSSP